MPTALIQTDYNFPGDPEHLPATVHAICPNLEGAHVKKGDYILSIKTPNNMHDMKAQQDGVIHMLVLVDDALHPEQVLFTLEAETTVSLRVKILEYSRALIKEIIPTAIISGAITYAFIVYVFFPYWPVLKTYVSENYSFSSPPSQEQLAETATDLMMSEIEHGDNLAMEERYSEAVTAYGNAARHASDINDLDSLEFLIEQQIAAWKHTR